MYQEVILKSWISVRPYDLPTLSKVGAGSVCVAGVISIQRTSPWHNDFLFFLIHFALKSNQQILKYVL